MENEKKPEVGLNRSHFARIHDKIFHKYVEMQKKLQKQQSVESVEVTKEKTNLSKSTGDLLDEVLKEDQVNDIDIPKCQIVIEHVHKEQPEVVYLNRSQSVLTLNSVDENELDDFNVFKFPNEALQSSFESLNLEELKEFDTKNENNSSPTPPVKVSFRDRIGSRIANAKEKRRSNSAGKNAAKEKKKVGKDKVEKFILSDSPKELNKTLTNHKKSKLGVVSVALIEASGWQSLEGDKHRLLFCRFRLGSEKSKSKSVKSNATTVKWQELFNLNLYGEYSLEISLWDKDLLLGRTLVNLLELEKEKTHKMRILMEGEVANVQIFILLTISATVNSFDSEETSESKGALEIFRQKAVKAKKWNNFSEIGWLYVVVHGAKGLPNQDCYCVIELSNERRMTLTENKTNDPHWSKDFIFYISDITDIIHFTIYEEKKSDVVGKVSIPLINIKNGEKVYYSLKDYTQRERAKGNNPRILLEMSITWNFTRAAVRVINPKEEKLLEIEEKFDRHLFARNLTRIKALFAAMEKIFTFWKSSFEWESRNQNLVGIIIWLPFCYCFKLWMLPLLFLVPFIWYRPPKYWIVKRGIKNTQESSENSETEKEDKISLVQKIIHISDMVQNVQNTIGKFASFGESVKNLFNFTVPFLSWIAITAAIVIAVVLFLFPANYLFMAWGIHKFTRKMIRPNLVTNNELLDLLSRVPDDETLLDCELIEVNDEEDEKSKS